MRNLYEKLLTTNIDEEQRKNFVKKIERILNYEWSNFGIKVNMFGSSVNFLGTSTSDVDICVTTSSKELENILTLSKKLQNQEPFNPERNLENGVNNRRFKIIIKEFRRAVEYLYKANLELCCEIYDEYECDDKIPMITLKDLCKANLDSKI
ncbi:27811_t:CDS:2 [Gigaspora margarita]|uniref:27811_t:CDS:1 n=1 Tax=Gigaspora margarita TaxID=4874 RepID=A0ABN7VH56_GIGMA|nr:27811_t:CDS:2 [Gigaspora margarita]